MLIALMADRARVKEYIPFLPPHEQESVSTVLDQLIERTGAEKNRAIVDELRRLMATAQLNFLPEIHPDWILEALLPETPRTIAAILRHLPGQHVQYLLDRLPQNVVKDLPSFSETFALNPELAAVLRRNFEASFAPMPSSTGGLKHFSFETLHFLSAEKLLSLFREVGLREVALAFGTLNPKTVEMILSRLSQRDAALLKLRLEKREVVSDDRLKKAQGHLLGLDLEGEGRGANPEGLFMESGFFVYSKALLPAHLEAGLVIQQKMTRPLGLLLKRHVDKNLPLNSEKTVFPYQKEIVQIARNMVY